MLKILIPRGESFNSLTNEFVYDGEDVVVTLEHSLASVSRWESKWKTPFLSNKPMTPEQTVDYVRCMIVDENVDASVLRRLTLDNMTAINDYMNDAMTATTFSKDPKKTRNREIVTAEIIYYWMIKLGIPLECENWHFNRLMTLIKVCSIKETPPKKMTKGEIFSQNRALNAARRKALHSKG